MAGWIAWLGKYWDDMELRTIYSKARYRNFLLEGSNDCNCCSLKSCLNQCLLFEYKYIFYSYHQSIQYSLSHLNLSWGDVCVCV